MKNNTADADIYERAREFFDREGYEGREFDYLVNDVLNFTQSELARAGKSDGDIRDEILEHAMAVEFEGEFDAVSKEAHGMWFARRTLSDYPSFESKSGFASIEEAYRWIMEANK